MKERPILFSGAMVRAILSGHKTQTRRVIKPQPDITPEWDEEEQVAKFYAADELVGSIKCPYGQPGDQLWVREAHSIHSAHGQHRDDGMRWGPWGGLPTMVSPDGTQICYFREGFDRSDPSRWRPSIHMPRWACRIVLEIVSVRVERLNDISEADALEEGITYNDIPNNGLDPMRARTWFRGLWSEINSPESWQANPWVWVVEFKRVAV